MSGMRANDAGGSSMFRSGLGSGQQPTILGMHGSNINSTMVGGNLGGIVYPRTIIDDNSQIRSNIDYSQFGFLPSILKSFQ